MKKIIILLTILSVIFYSGLISAGVIINSPLNNSEVLNLISNTLNVSVADGFNSTVNYSWNNGLKNYTLCTNCYSPNYTTITFPRQGFYNISVWAFNSTGSFQSNISYNVYVGNRTNYINNRTINPDTRSKNCLDSSGICYNNGLGGNAVYSLSVSSSSAKSFFFFNTTAVVNVTIVNATMSFYHTGLAAGCGQTATFSRINQSWVETDNTKPTVNSTTDGTIVFVGGESAQYKPVDLTGLYQEFTNGLTNYGVRLFSNGGTSCSFTGGFQSSGDKHFPILNLSYINGNTRAIITNLYVNNSNSTSRTINFTYNVSDDNDFLSNISIILDGIINSTIYYPTINTTINNTFNFSIANIQDGNHSWYIKAYDSDGLVTNSTNFTFTLDATAPVITVSVPTEGQAFTTTNISFNYSVLDSGVGLSTCWWKNDTDSNNITVPCNQNFTFIQAAGNHYIYFWANDSFNNINNVTVSYQIDLTNPSINLLYPSNDQWFNYGNNINFNFTAQDPNSNGIKNCSLYSNWTGTWNINQTNTTVISGGSVINYNFKANLTDGYYKWNVLCFESLGLNSNWGLVNKTFGIDTIIPNVTYINLNTTLGSQTISFNFSTNDTNLVNCSYSIFNSSNNIDGLNNNIIYTCNSLGSATVSSFGSYTLQVCAIDKALNTNCTNNTFTVSASPVTPSPGSGGGGNLIEQQFIVAGENGTWSMKTSTGSKSYDFYMNFNSTQKKMLYFKNLGTQNITLELTCQDVSGDFCSRTVFSNKTIFILPSKNLDKIESFTINSYNFTRAGIYDFNIVATNTADKSNTKLSVRVRITSFNPLTWFFNKITGKTMFNLSFINDSLSQIYLYNAFILLIVLIFGSLFLFFIAFSWTKVRFILTFSTIILICFILLFFLD